MHQNKAEKQTQQIEAAALSLNSCWQEDKTSQCSKCGKIIDKIELDWAFWNQGGKGKA